MLLSLHCISLTCASSSPQAREAVDAHPKAPVAALLHARCLLRVGRREEALTALRQAAAAALPTADSKTAGKEDEEDEEDEDGEDGGDAAGQEGGSLESAGEVQAMDAAWAASRAGPMLRATRAAERRQAIAIDHYERGRFDEAASAYREALQCVEAGAWDDVHCRAALHANVAACLRRDKKQEAAVAECDKALSLLPRFGRALFRKAACLLEAGKPVAAVDAFEELYRVDRTWPRLSDWLLRSHAAQRRNAECGDTDDSPNRRSSSSRPRKSWYSSGADAGNDAGGSSSSPGGEGGEETDGDKLSKESDHYIVLGVTCDATDKQIQQAYRMRSLKFHPDRKGGSTAAFQRIAQAFQTLSDPDKRTMYDQGVDIKSRRGGGDSDDSEEVRATWQCRRDSNPRPLPCIAPA